jgi:hypothetical protein
MAPSADGHDRMISPMFAVPGNVVFAAEMGDAAPVISVAK